MKNDEAAISLKDKGIRRVRKHGTVVGPTRYCAPDLHQGNRDIVPRDGGYNLMY